MCHSPGGIRRHRDSQAAANILWCTISQFWGFEHPSYLQRLRHLPAYPVPFGPPLGCASCFEAAALGVVSPPQEHFPLRAMLPFVLWVALVTSHTQ